MNAHRTKVSLGPARGVALITTLCLLALLSAASLAMVLLVSSDTLINGYYGNYRGSFYAADSGINITVGAVQTAILASAKDSVNPPLPQNAVPPAVVAAYTQFEGGYFVVGDPNSWNEQFKVIANPGGAPVLGTPTVTSVPNPVDPKNPADLVWTYTYPYTVTTQGQSSGKEAEVITENGNIVYTSTTGAGASGGPPSFAGWGAFIDKFAACQGSLVPGTMSGPFFTDGQWNFGNSSNPGYTFTDPVGQSGADVSWIKNNNCQNSPSVPKGFTSPNFKGGLQLNQNPVVPPTDTYNQAQAVIDGKGLPPCQMAPCAPDPPPSQSEMNQVLSTVSGTSYPSSGNAPNGVYFPSYTSGTSPTGAACSAAKPCFGSSTSVGGSGYGGGFYVQGNASITLAATTTGSDQTQTFTIDQGGAITTIVVDNTANTTTIASGSNSQTLQGVPTQVDPNTGQVMTQTDPGGQPVDPTLVYVNGQITGLTGDYDSNGNPLPAVQNGVGLTVAASGDISITGDLTYSSSQMPVSIPGDTLNTTSDAGIFGIYTTGNINLNPDPSGNLVVDASLAAISGDTSGFETPGQGINNWTIVGGRSEDQAHGVNINRGNTYFDRRFATMAPPWFPTAVPQPGSSAIPPSQSYTITRTSWQEVSRP